MLIVQQMMTKEVFKIIFQFQTTCFDPAQPTACTQGKNNRGSIIMFGSAFPGQKIKIIHIEENRNDAIWDVPGYDGQYELDPNPELR
jgi:hypothetical protein